ncbi:hypothetical protein C8Q78DRAFT_249271 [Trametes maxima]|nr:hypothetical protein C8Q78DRAFT_249271 [Trametes maxima]
MSYAHAPRGDTPISFDVLDRLSSSLLSDTPPPGPSSAMENSRLPIELCEAIMDVVIGSRHFLAPDEHETLIACRAVCRDWSDHVLDLLNKLTLLDSPHAVSSFVSAIRRTSADRAYFVWYMEPWNNVQGDRNLSQAIDLLMVPLPNLQNPDAVPQWYAGRRQPQRVGHHRAAALS